MRLSAIEDAEKRTRDSFVGRKQIINDDSKRDADPEG